MDILIVAPLFFVEVILPDIMRQVILPWLKTIGICIIIVWISLWAIWGISRLLSWRHENMLRYTRARAGRWM